MFLQADKRLIYDNILEQIIEAIRTNQLKPGSKIPGEISLSKSFGVSRNAVREALKALELIGILESKPGRGRYVSQNALQYLKTNEIVKLFFDAKHLSDLVEVRKALEGQVAYLAAQNASEKDIKKLKAILLQESETPDVDVHGKFHQTLAEVAGNKIILSLLDAIRPELILQRAIFKTFTDEALKQFQFEHWEILDAIARRDPDQARKLMLEHIHHSHSESIAPERNVSNLATD
ncbi:FadR/GntR family transcriptional regulator [Acetomicrobium sp.]|jgi:GntR family transcriptional repressor for pyruvate dehydrogenase complex|uniref:FadR/GntR family transcriptional regulator n=1 Tax=Acetomicrobium sp. TaxID=1872099 RepID=UPI002B257595|nr:FadR/GntR family transcriptional regulator [Acetomicrobium sp.]